MNRLFIGREAEMKRLNTLLDKSTASLIVVRGRRRIGKSRLLAEFGKNMRSFFFSGIPPTTKTTAQSQRDEFARQLEKIGLAGVKSDDWGNLFWHLAQYVQRGRILIVFDEISWMGSKDPDFLGKLKHAWDMYFSQNPELIVALCGSISVWIEENILSSTGFLGRISIDMILKELSLSACNRFWHPNEERIAAFEKFKFLSVVGGVPFYLEQIRPNLSAEQNIQELCFTAGGLLVREFDNIFSDLFSRRAPAYREIVKCLSQGPLEQAQLCLKLNKTQGGGDTKYLEDLLKSGFIQRDFSWSLRTGREGSTSRYRLSDNYLRFYLKYIAPNQSKIEKELWSSGSIHGLPGWESLMGFQFENLILNNRKALWALLNISVDEILMDGPFFQKKTLRRAGCQIDYLLQTRFNTLYLCEIKFSKNRIDSEVIKQMEEKRKKLQIPRFCSIRPILIHVNGVEDSVAESRYFDKIIDFSQLFSG